MRTLLLLAGLPLLWPAPAPAQRFPRPPATNDPRLEEPPPRPSAEGAQERARQLFDAIKAGDPTLGLAFFMPREVFRQIKGVADPDRFYDRMLAMFERDVRELHEALGTDAERATFLRLELSRRRGWVGVREESNRLPYWAQRHNTLVYRVGDEERHFEVRTLNAWDGEWYLTHLSEFRR
ncbi:MAG: hypothetical protein AAF447_24385 [Myxococcota bacterium]